jgi:hypothetical protein
MADTVIEQTPSPGGGPAIAVDGPGSGGWIIQTDGTQADGGIEAEAGWASQPGPGSTRCRPAPIWRSPTPTATRSWILQMAAETEAEAGR